MAFTRQQQPGNNSNATTVTVAFSNVNAGALLVIYWEGHGVGATCSDPTNGSWTALTDRSGDLGGSSKHHRTFYFIGAAAGSYTATVTGATGTQYAQGAEYTAAGAITIDAASENSANGASSPGSVATAGTLANHELVIAGIANNQESLQTIASGTGTTLIGTCNQSASGATAGLCEQTGIDSGTATSVTLQLTDTSTIDWAMDIIGFKEAAAAVIGPDHFGLEPGFAAGGPG